MLDRLFCKLFPSPIFRECLFEFSHLAHNGPNEQAAGQSTINNATEADQDILRTIAMLALQDERWARSIIKGCVISELKRIQAIENVFASRSHADRLLRAIIEPGLLKDVLPVFKQALVSQDFDTAKVVLQVFEGLAQVKWSAEVAYTAKLLVHRIAVKDCPESGHLAMLKLVLGNLLVPRLFSVVAEAPPRNPSSSRRFLRIVQLFKYAIEIGSGAGEPFHTYYNRIASNLHTPTDDQRCWTPRPVSEGPALQAKLLNFLFRHALAMGRRIRSSKTPSSKKLFATWVKLIDAVRTSFEANETSTSLEQSSSTSEGVASSGAQDSSHSVSTAPTTVIGFRQYSSTLGISSLLEKVAGWSCSDVATWLEENSLEELRPLVLENQITGADLLDLSHISSLLVSSSYDLVLMEAFFRAHRQLCMPPIVAQPSDSASSISSFET